MGGLEGRKGTLRGTYRCKADPALLVGCGRRPAEKEPGPALQAAGGQRATLRGRQGGLEPGAGRGRGGLAASADGKGLCWVLRSEVEKQQRRHLGSLGADRDIGVKRRNVGPSFHPDVWLTLRVVAGRGFEFQEPGWWQGFSEGGHKSCLRGSLT